MPATASVNKLSVVHQASNGVTIAFPDVCKTPSPAGPIPIPYPNIAQVVATRRQGAKKVKCDGNPICVKDSNFKMSTGDEAGSRRRRRGLEQDQGQGRVRELLVRRARSRARTSPRAFDLMLHNDKNTPPFPVLQPPLPALSMTKDPECLCACCGETYKPAGG